MNLNQLNQTVPVAVIGAAFGDIIIEMNKLPVSGGDEVASEQSRQIGGCAFNVARALSRMGINIINGIPVGNGPWGDAAKQAMLKEGIEPILFNNSIDNGWCLAIVEPDKERTFITVEGCEQYWSQALLNKLNVEHCSIVYVSGYELVDKESEPLKTWLLGLDDSIKIFVDFGPRLGDIEASFINKLLLKQPVLTVNRDELKVLIGSDSATISDAEAFSNNKGISFIYRLDEQGAWAIEPNSAPVNIMPYEVDVVDTIAAGDSHCGGVIAGLSSGWSLEDCVRLGNMVAAMVVATQGADGAPTKLKLEAFNNIQQK